MRRKAMDIAREYCTNIDNKNNSHVRCNFCGHKMQGITRFKEHLVGKRGDVSPCECCPKDVKEKMDEALIQISLKREEKERRTRDTLQSRIRNAPPPPPPPPSPSNNKKRPAAAATADDLEAEERAIMEKVMEKSLQTFEMEKVEEANKYEDDEIEAAIRESMRSYYKEEAWRRGEGCSKYARAGHSSFGNYESIIDVDSDYDSDEDFSF